MPRRSSFQWSPANIVILVVIAVLVALGAAYWTQISQQIGSGLGAFVGGAAGDPEIVPVPALADKSCLADTTKTPVKMGDLKFSKLTFSAKDETQARKQALDYFKKYISKIDCNKNQKAQKITLGTGEIIESEGGLKVPEELKELLKCGRNEKAKPQCGTMCQKTGTQCSISFSPEHCSLTVTNTEKRVKGLNVYSAEATCSVNANYMAQCQCAAKTKCYAFRGSGEYGPGGDGNLPQGKDQVMCICPNEKRAKDECPALFSGLCKKGEKYRQTDSAQSSLPGEPWIVTGSCDKETSTETPTASVTSPPTTTATATPTATASITPALTPAPTNTTTTSSIPTTSTI